MKDAASVEGAANDYIGTFGWEINEDIVRDWAEAIGVDPELFHAKIIELKETRHDA